MAKLSVEFQKYFLDEPVERETENSLTDGSLTDGSLTEESTSTDSTGESFSSQTMSPKVPSDDITLNEILEVAGERTFGFLFVLLALPSALPLPAPGYSTPFGIILFLLSSQLMLGKEQPWMPEKWRKRGFKREKVQAFLRKGIPWLQRFEKISRPRLTAICTSRGGQTLVGAVLTLAAMSMILPLPLTNTIPAFGVLLAGLGLSDDDGLMLLAGLFICSLGVALTSSFLYLIFFVFGGLSNRKAAEEAIKTWIKGLF
ncbi:MAG: exopolysaccharide biosynthesis protein [Cyanobacteria bacterium J06627_28]